MPVLKTSFWGTHTNDIQERADFKTRIVSPTAVAVQVTVFRDEKIVDKNDFVLDNQQPTSQICVGANFVTLEGELKLDMQMKLVLFSGNLAFPGQVSAALNPMIIAAAF